MSKTVVMIHGACAGGWCFADFTRVLERHGWTCHAPNLRYHGGPTAEPDPRLAETSIADYTGDMARFIEELGTVPIVIGHSMGGLIAQQLAAKGLARGLVLMASCAPWGVLPATDDERALAKKLMSGGSFWKEALQPAFEVAKGDSLAGFEPRAQRTVFEKLGPESGRALFEVFFWMFDNARTTTVDAARVRCPVLVMAGSQDKVVSAATGRSIAQLYGRRGMFHLVEGRGHFLPLEPGWEDLALLSADWMSDAAMQSA